MPSDHEMARDPCSPVDPTPTAQAPMLTRLDQCPPTRSSGPSSGAPRPVVVQTSRSDARIIHEYAAHQALCLNIVIVTLACICVFANAIAISQIDRAWYTGAGFWCSMLFIIAGSLGVNAAKVKAKSMISGHLVMCIIASTFTGLQLVISTVSASLKGHTFSCGSFCDHLNVRIAIAMNIIIVVCSLINMIIAILAAVLCCRALCCQRNRLQGTYMFVPGSQGQQCVATQVVSADGQTVYIMPVQVDGCPNPEQVPFVMTQVPPRDPAQPPDSSALTSPPAYTRTPPPYSRAT